MQIPNVKLQIQPLRALEVSLALFIALIVFHPFSASAPDARLHVDFLDVGQGDSALITFPDGETMLVDGGGRIDYKKQWIKREGDDEPEFFEPDTQTVGETVVSRFLVEPGYEKIGYIVATHADAAHIQELAAVAKPFRARAQLFDISHLKTEELEALCAVLL
mgnify:CR=1 FL=1